MFLRPHTIVSGLRLSAVSRLQEENAGDTPSDASLFYLKFFSWKLVSLHCLQDKRIKQENVQMKKTTTPEGTTELERNC